MLCIVWTHSRLPEWEGVPEYFSRLSLCNEIGQDAVAPFFLITGFLFYRNFRMDRYAAKLKTRFRSLVIPYLLWNTFTAIFLYLVICHWGYTYISAHIYFDSIGEIVGSIFACDFTVLWYVGVIIVYALVAPLFYYLGLNKRVAIGTIIVFFIIGIAFHHPFTSPLVWMSIYMMGTLWGMHYSSYLYGPQPLWLSLMALALYPFCVWLNHASDCMMTVNLRQWISVFFFIGVYDLINNIVHFVPHAIYQYSFFLYATHYWPIHILQRYIILSDKSEAACWIAYLLVPAAVVIICLAAARWLDVKAHHLYRILSGDR